MCTFKNSDGFVSVKMSDEEYNSDYFSVLPLNFQNIETRFLLKYKKTNENIQKDLVTIFSEIFPFSPGE